MNIGDVRIVLAEPEPSGRLLAYASFTIDRHFAVRDCKVIRLGERLLVCMPSRDVYDRCGACNGRNPVRQRHCGRCGIRLPDQRAELDVDGKAMVRADVCFPTDQATRDAIEAAVFRAYGETAPVGL